MLFGSTQFSVICMAFINYPPTSSIHIVHSNQRIQCSLTLEREWFRGTEIPLAALGIRSLDRNQLIILLLIVERLPATAYRVASILLVYWNPINFALIIARFLCVCSFLFDYILSHQNVVSVGAYLSHNFAASMRILFMHTDNALQMNSRANQRFKTRVE